MLNQYAYKDVLSVFDAANAGKVIGAYVHKSNYRFAGLAVKNEHMYILPLKKVTGIYERIAISDLSSLTLPTDEHILLELGVTSGYTDEGEYCGEFSNLTLKGSPLFIWFDKPFPVSKIAAVNDNTVTINLSLRSPKTPKRDAVLQKSKGRPAKKSIEDYSFILGKIVIRDIYDNFGGILIKRGSVVNYSTLIYAGGLGKLMELALSVLLD